MKTRAALVGGTSATLLILLLGSNVAIAAESQSLTLSFSGILTDIGSQTYRSSGGSLVSASVTAAGKTISLSSAHLEYSIDAKVQGNNVAGHATLQLKSHVAKSGEDTKSSEDTSLGQFSVAGRFDLTGIIPAVGFPITDPTNPLACLPNSCTSEIPGFLVGVGDLTLRFGDSRITLPSTPMLFESAYLNPFGGPIFIGTPDGSISIAAKYSSAISHWANVKTSGSVQAGTSDQGAFTLVSDLTENLLKGTETDRGKITLFGFASTPALNSAGDFKGKSVIPTAGEFDCTSMLTGQLNTIGFPLTLPPNTCTATGATSTGGFELRSAQGENEIKGTYLDNWFVPAIGFVGQATATMRGD